METMKLQPRIDHVQLNLSLQNLSESENSSKKSF